MKAIVTEPILSLMTEASAESGLADEALFGMTVEAGEQTGNYYKIITPYRYEGYAEKSGLLVDEDAVLRWENHKLYTVTRFFLDVMEEPRVSARRIITLPRGARIPALEEKDGWTKTELPSGKQGWVCTSSIALPDNTPWQERGPMALRSDIVRTALSYLGVQYRWGGKTPAGIDCSGLCSMSYLMNGVVIYRDASIEEGFPVHEIPMSRIAEGDLIFFPGHVAMYIGNGHYIHSTGAAGSNGVVINSLRPEDSDYRPDLIPLIKAVGSIF